MRQIRMAWNINGNASCGDWLVDTPENRRLIEDQITAGQRFGPHHLETRSSSSASESAEPRVP
jgi:hypothetical protein